MRTCFATIFLLLALVLPAYAQSFAAVETNIVPTQQSALVLGDLDSDGRLDIITTGLDASGQSIAKIYRNDGDLHFSETGSGLGRVVASSLDLGDYDRDGDLDLLLTGTQISGVFRNDGNFQFTRLPLTLPTTTLAGGVQELVNTPSSAWGDYDRDGDLDILFSGGSASLLYRNDGDGQFTAVDAGLPDLLGGSVEWGDFNNDGLIDILATHQPGPTGTLGFTRIYRNDANGTFQDIEAGLPGTNGLSFETGSATWGDADGDGDLDVLFMADGLLGGSLTPVGLYRNDEGRFSVTTSGLPTAYFGNFIDFDSDGRLDVMLNRIDTAAGNGTTNTFLTFFRNADDAAFAATEARLPGIWYGAVATGDLDSDGHLDVLATGAREQNQRASDEVVALYRNTTRATANQRPLAPTNLRSSRNGGDLVLEWDAATDPDNSAASLTYNVRVGTTPGGHDVLSSMSHADGTRLVPSSGNTGHTRRLVLRGLDPTLSYFWAVQSVDASYAGSAFAEESVSVDAAEAADLPHQFALDQNYPNPFNPGTTITYALPERAPVRVAVYNVLGAEVAVLIDGVRPAGRHEVYWNGRNAVGHIVPSGLYLYRLETPSQTFSRSMVLLK